MFNIEHQRNNWYLLVGWSDKENPLEGSVEKWQAVVDFLEAHPGTTLHDGSCSTCALCHEYGIYSDQPAKDRWACRGCPVSMYTGLPNCQDTPYSDYCNDYTLTNARRELEFLRMVAR